MSKKGRKKSQGPKKPYQSRGELKNQAASPPVESVKPQAAPPPPPPVETKSRAPKPVIAPPPKTEPPPRIYLPQKTPPAPRLPRLPKMPQGPLARSLFGLSIPILSFLLMLALPAAGLAAFFIATLAYIIYTIALDEVRRDRSALLTFAKFAASGAFIAIALTLLAHDLPFGVIFPLFPSSVLWMVFGDSDSWFVLAGMHMAAIMSNAFLYLLYGCIIHHFRNFLRKRSES